MIVVIDTREQRPFAFPDGITTRRAALPAGDYSIEGLERRVAIERKSLADLYGTVGRTLKQRKHRGRGKTPFERELALLGTFDFAAIVVESSLETIVRHPPDYSDLKPKTVFACLIAWSQRYGVHVMPAGQRTLAARWTYRTLDRFWREHQERKRRGRE